MLFCSASGFIAQSAVSAGVARSCRTEAETRERTCSQEPVCKQYSMPADAHAFAEMARPGQQAARSSLRLLLTSISSVLCASDGVLLSSLSLSMLSCATAFTMASDKTIQVKLRCCDARTLLAAPPGGREQ